LPCAISIRRQTPTHVGLASCVHWIRFLIASVIPR
jgi:hypothetical protein